MLPSPVSDELQDLGIELSEKSAHLAGMIQIAKEQAVRCLVND